MRSAVAKFITDLGGPVAVGSYLNRPITTVASWQSRGSIPIDHWPRLVDLARERKVKGVNYEMLVSMHAAMLDAPKPNVRKAARV